MQPDNGDFAERIQTLINVLGVKSVNAFASSIGVGASVVQNFLGKNAANKKSKPTLETIEKIMARYPRVNPVYLLTGRGEPLLPYPGQEHVVSDVVVGYGNAVGTNNTTRIEIGTLDDCRRELVAARTSIKELEATIGDKQLIIELLKKGQS